MNHVAAPNIETRADAVAFLKARGVHAFERDWAMGETIGVATVPSESEGITVFARLVYIAKSDSGWTLHDFTRPATPTVLVASLPEACQRALRTVLRQDGG